jgi:hypothetical protein
MACKSSGIGCSPQPQGCADEYGCISGVCPDFTIRRGDTKPVFKVKMEDCDGPMDLTGLVLEATMWAKGKLKKPLSAEDNYFSLADNIGFNQIMVGDIIIIDRPRLPEKMLVTGFDEDNRLVLVERAYHGTTAQNFKRGTPLRIMKFINAPSQTEMIYQDIIELDGTTTENSLVDSFFVYEWGLNDTCLPGCYYIEFKLIKMLESSVVPSLPSCSDQQANFPYSNGYPEGTEYGPVGPYVPDGSNYEPGLYEVPGPGNAPPEPPLHPQPVMPVCGPIIVDNPSQITWNISQIVLPDITPYPSMILGTSIIPNFTSPSYTPSTFGCGLVDGVDWIRRFPVDSEGFLIKIVDAPLTE